MNHYSDQGQCVHECVFIVRLDHWSSRPNIHLLVLIPVWPLPNWPEAHARGNNNSHPSHQGHIHTPPDAIAFVQYNLPYSLLPHSVGSLQTRSQGHQTKPQADVGHSESTSSFQAVVWGLNEKVIRKVRISQHVLADKMCCHLRGAYETAWEWWKRRSCDGCRCSPDWTERKQLIPWLLNLAVSTVVVIAL
jgi:hypothetical protein